MFPERRVAMKIKSFLLVLMFALTLVMWAQDKPAQAPPGPGSGNQMRAEHRQKMMEMHKQEMEAMRADIEKMKSSLTQMKANVLTIRDRSERDITLAKQRGYVGNGGYPHGPNAKEHGIDGTRHDARPWHGRPTSYSANRKET
jgi:hypothetical protein